MSTLTKCFRFVRVPALASIACVTLLSVSSAQVGPGVTTYVTETIIPLRDNAGGIRGYLKLHRHGGVLTYDVTDEQGNPYSPAGIETGPPPPPALPGLPSSSLDEKADANDDLQKLRDDLDKVNASLNVVISRVNELSAAR